jgi:hypothetical protein
MGLGEWMRIQENKNRPPPSPPKKEKYEEISRFEKLDILSRKMEI